MAIQVSLRVFVAANGQNVDAGAAVRLFGADGDDDMIGAGEQQGVIRFERPQPRRIDGGKMQFVAHAFEGGTEPRDRARRQLGKRPKLRLDARDDGTVDGVQPAVRTM